MQSTSIANAASPLVYTLLGALTLDVGAVVSIHQPPAADSSKVGREDCPSDVDVLDVLEPRAHRTQENLCTMETDEREEDSQAPFPTR